MLKSISKAKVRDPKPLLDLAEARRISADKWYRYLWGWHQFLTGLGWALSALVPFGLALMLFVPVGEMQRIINLAVILVSAAAFTCLVETNATRLRERATLNRDISGILAVALAEYHGNLISIDQLKEEVESAYRLDRTETSA